MAMSAVTSDHRVLSIRAQPHTGGSLGLDNLSVAATEWRNPSPGGWFPAMPDPSDVETARADIKALLPEIRDWLAER